MIIIILIVLLIILWKQSNVSLPDRNWDNFPTKRRMPVQEHKTDDFLLTLYLMDLGNEDVSRND